MISIKQAMACDAVLLAEIGLTAWQKGLMPHVPPRVSKKFLRDNPFVPFLNTQGSRVLVGFIDHKPVGFGACEGCDDTISDIWVAPAFEGMGVGSAIINALEKEIIDRGYSHAHIQVAAANERAYALYMHLGYREIWRRTEFDVILDIKLEKIGLTKQLK
ncbi:Acetyltransferase YpeA [Serratia fonticola]|uniref:GNAT family N-acetyltransferase n=1 Tax=Serratia fonticola TaxID=47917 RepID=UPI002182A4DF|nr:GNAT family N-acetyltransferase [Serratia fonticola]CAI2065067.1 Acetyltransferase YpeA [Serratia fonticola]